MEDKVVSHQEDVRYSAERYTLMGSGSDLSGYAWQLSQTNLGNQPVVLNITASGYGGSFKRKLEESPDGLVTGSLSVLSTATKVSLGDHTVVWKILSPPERYSGVKTSLFPDVTAPLAPSGLSVQALNNALRRLAGKYNDSRQILLAVAVAELGSSVDSAKILVNQSRTIFSKAERLMLSFFNREERRLSFMERRRLARGLNPKLPARQVRRSIRRILDFQAKQWLTVSFGMRPLISDLKGLSQATYAKRNRSNLMPLRAVDFAGSASGPTMNSQVSGKDTLRVTAVTHGKSTVKLRSVIKVDEVDLWQNKLGLSGRDLPSTIYELIPYSWLVDYVTNVGDMITHYSAFGLRKGRTQVTKVNESKSVWSYQLIHGTHNPLQPVVSRSFTPQKKTRTVLSIERYLEEGVPSPRFTTKLPTGDIQLTNLAALAWVKVSKARLGDALNRIIRHY